MRISESRFANNHMMQVISVIISSVMITADFHSGIVRIFGHYLGNSWALSIQYLGNILTIIN